ncbi:ABC transporter ATP-binding protein [Streptomonospora nanhaiensis]|uniref:Peptide/nickel transport system ATP-binding protein n=1 Tax=Streptomonospora nanhaiensis TaxID=1323731 RepID=A0A853BHC2_9ACTN|nr:ATP-binding cassette domain-containing protein [Streptomonospora nanhaiensis]MBX9387526.1 ATP-binding cassette domain-containing protein [Streptomonospora nanhaiensis]NYI94135.1 peptide/nickel transport system ATP-binding protein [Streptomonospora nanhaiensis]
MLDLHQVGKTYRVGAFGGERLHAVRGVDLAVGRGEVVSLIGESGSGKSTIGKMVLRLIAPSAGTITFDGADVAAVRGHRASKEYYRRVQGVFQDPFSCFNPVFAADRVLQLVRAEYFPGTPEADWRAKVEEALTTVRLDPAQVLGKYPHQLSGGQLQRLLIARALLLDIRMLVADEIISMLDASTRIDVLNLLGDLKARGLGILFITHDLSLGNYISDTAVILRRGRVVEKGPTGEVFAAPAHPYTRRLLSSVPQLHTTWEQADEALRADGERECPGCAEGGEPGAHGLVETAPGHHVGCFATED